MAADTRHLRTVTDDRGGQCSAGRTGRLRESDRARPFGDARQVRLTNASLFRSCGLDGIGELRQRVEMEVGRRVFRFDRAAGTRHAVPPLDPA